MCFLKSSDSVSVRGASPEMSIALRDGRGKRTACETRRPRCLRRGERTVTADRKAWGSEDRYRLRGATAAAATPPVQCAHCLHPREGRGMVVQGKGAELRNGTQKFHLTCAQPAGKSVFTWIFQLLPLAQQKQIASMKGCHLPRAACRCRSRAAHHVCIRLVLVEFLSSCRLAMSSKASKYWPSSTTS